MCDHTLQRLEPQQSLELVIMPPTGLSPAKLPPPPPTPPSGLATCVQVCEAKPGHMVASVSAGEVHHSSLPGAVLGFVSLSLQLGLVFGYQPLNLRLHALCAKARLNLQNSNIHGRERTSTFDFTFKTGFFGVIGKTGCARGRRHASRQWHTRLC